MTRFKGKELTDAEEDYIAYLIMADVGGRYKEDSPDKEMKKALYRLVKTVTWQH